MTHRNRKGRIRLTPSNLPLIRELLAKEYKHKMSLMSEEQRTQYSHFVDRAWSYYDTLSNAPLWWVSRDMTRLAVDTAAHGDLPGFKPPSQTGFVVFDGGLPIECDEIPHVVAIVWQVKGRFPDRERGFAWHVDADLYTDDLSVDPWYPHKAPITQVPDKTSDLGLARAWVDVLTATWALSQEPRICDTVPARSSSRDPIPARFDREVSRVKMLVLRENLHRPGTTPAPGEDDPSNYSHRWIVRGFYREQPYGPRHSLRRRQWIPPYVKGPADKPLVVKETVRIWRR